MKEKKQPIPVELPTFDDLISTELKKYDDIVPKVEELKKEFMPLTIASIEDKEGYEQVKEALKFMVAKRHSIEDKRKELKADSLKFGRAVDERAKEIQAMISPIELHLKEQKERVDLELKAIQEAEERATQERISKRHERLLSMGFAPMIDEFVWVSKLDGKPQSVHKLNIDIWDDEKFYKWCDSFQANVIDQEQVYIKERDERAAKELSEFQAQQAKLQEEQAKLKEEQDNMLKQMAEMKEARAELRIASLTNLGLVLYGTSYAYKNADGAYIPLANKDFIFDANQKDWDENFEFFKKQIEKIKLDDEETKKQREKKAEDAALAKIELEKAAELERINGLNDEQKFDAFVSSLLNVSVPEFKTKKYKAKAEGLLEVIKTK
jgi:hypothetical protein